MATNPKNLSHAFKGADPDDHRLARFLMVGGIHDKETVISVSDLGLLQHALRVFASWELPVTEDLDAVRDRYKPPSRESVRIINILPEQGGEDFLSSSEKGDVVILCNIARDVSDDAILRRGNMAHLNMAPSLRASFTSSPHHRDIKRWQQQLDDTGAKIVMVTNSDGFELPELNNGKFCQVSLSHYTAENDHFGFLVRKDYLAAVEDYLLIQAIYTGKASPFLEIVQAANDQPDTRFSYDLASDRIRHFSGPR